MANLALKFVGLRDSSQCQPALFTPITLFALIGLIFSSLAVAHASSPSADSVREPISTFSVSGDGFISSVAFFPDGRLLALLKSSPTTVELWDVSTGKSIANFPARGFVEAVAFSPNGRLLALAPNDGTSTIKLWDMSSGKLHVAMVSAHEKDEYEPQHSGVHSLSFSPDGKLLASGGTNDSLVKLWDVSSGKQVATLTGDNRGSIASVVFPPTVGCWLLWVGMGWLSCGICRAGSKSPRFPRMK